MVKVIVGGVYIYIYTVTDAFKLWFIPYLTKVYQINNTRLVVNHWEEQLL